MSSWESYFANYAKIGNYDARLQPFHLTYGGHIRSGVLENVGNQGDYWSSTTISDIRSYRFDLWYKSIYPASDDARYNGYSIRCLAR